MTQPGILTHGAILDACGLARTGSPDDETQSGLIRPCRRRHIRTAGYDLRLGAQYYIHSGQDGEHEGVRIKTLSPNAPNLVIPPNGVVVVAAREELWFDTWIVGHLSLKMDLLLKGLIMASQSQIDAGYKGRIFALLYNLSTENVSISLGDPFLRLELVRLPTEAIEYDGDYQQRTLSDVLRRPLNSSLRDTEEQIRRTSRSVDERVGAVRRFGWVGVSTLVVSVIFGFVPVTLSLSDRLDHVEERAAEHEAQLRPPPEPRAALERRMDILCDEIAQLRKQRRKVGPAATAC